MKTLYICLAIASLVLPAADGLNHARDCNVTRIYKTPGPMVAVSKQRVVQWAI